MLEEKFIAFYVRHSKRVAPLENQLIQLEKYRVERGIRREQVRLYTDVGSGARASRTDFDLMLSDIQLGIISQVVVRDLSRVFRDVEFFAKFLKVLRRYKVTLFALKENVDVDSAMGRFFSMVSAAQHQCYREVLIENTLAGLERAVKNGKKLGRPPGVKDKKKRKRVGYFLRYQPKQRSVLDEV